MLFWSDVFGVDGLDGTGGFSGGTGGFSGGAYLFVTVNPSFWSPVISAV